MDPALLARTLRQAHEGILTGGLLGVLSVLAGFMSRWIGAPVLLIFLAIGMSAGEDGVLGIDFNDYALAYLAGSIALAVILFEGGLQTPLAALRQVFWPAAVLATVGVAVTTAVVGGVFSFVQHVPLRVACLAGAVVAPTDAAAVSSLLRRSGAKVPERLLELLEVESGLNDPMSVFLTFALLQLVAEADRATLLVAAMDFAREMFGGAGLGLACGWVLRAALAWLRLESALANVLALTGALAVFGAAQLAHTSGFLATYLAGVMLGGIEQAASGGSRRYCCF